MFFYTVAHEAAQFIPKHAHVLDELSFNILLALRLIV